MVVVNIAIKTKMKLGLNMVLKTIFLINNVNNVNGMRCQCSQDKDESWTPSSWPGSMSHVSDAELFTWATFSCPSAASLSGAALLMRCFDNQEASVVKIPVKICKFPIQTRPMLNRWRSWSWTTPVNAFNLKFCLEPMPELGPASTGRGIGHLKDIHSLSWHSLQFTLNSLYLLLFLKWFLTTIRSSLPSPCFSTLRRVRGERGKVHFSQKNHCNDNCNDFSDYNDIIASLDKLIMSFIKLIITLSSGVQ